MRKGILLWAVLCGLELAPAAAFSETYDPTMMPRTMTVTEPIAYETPATMPTPTTTMPGEPVPEYYFDIYDPLIDSYYGGGGTADNVLFGDNKTNQRTFVVMVTLDPNPGRGVPIGWYAEVGGRKYTGGFTTDKDGKAKLTFNHTKNVAPFTIEFEEKMNDAPIRYRGMITKNFTGDDSVGNVTLIQRARLGGGGR